MALPVNARSRYELRQVSAARSVKRRRRKRIWGGGGGGAAVGVVCQCVFKGEECRNVSIVIGGVAWRETHRQVRRLAEVAWVLGGHVWWWGGRW